MNKEEIIQTLKDNPIKIIKCGDIEIPVEYLKQTTVNVNGDDYIKLQQENKILKENAENNDKVVDKVNWENQLLKKENKQLKDSWNELREYLNYKSERAIGEDEYVYDEIYNKMQEMEINYGDVENNT